MSDWRHVPAGKIARQRREIVRLEPETEYRTMGVRWYGKGAYDRGVVTTETVKAKVLYRAREGDFIFNRIDTQKGAFDVVSAELDGALTTNEFPLYEVSEEEVDARFLLLNFQRPKVLRQISAMRAGSEGRARWKEVDFEAWMVPVPPLPVQRRIIEVIGAVNNQIAALDTESEALEGILQSLRSNLPQTDHQPIGEVLLGIDSGKSVQAGGEASAEDEYRILKLSAVQRGWFKASEAKTLTESAAFSPSHVVKNGDLLITRANTPERVGFVAVAKNVLEGTFMPDLIWRLRVDESRVSTDYLEHALSSRELRTRISGTSGGTSKSMVKINKRGFGVVRVPIPPLPEQREYVSRCNAVVGGITATRTEESRLRKIRAGLLARLLDRTIDIEFAEQEV
jgi:type I restriction enzyme S subunit